VFDGFGNIVTDPDEIARIQYAQEQGLPFPGEIPPTYVTPPGGLDRVAKGLRDPSLLNGQTSGPGRGLDPITGDTLLPDPAVVDPTPPGPPRTPSGGGIAGIAAQGAGAPSDYEQELLNMLQSREKRATQDKWLALAQAGLSLMSSKNPTFGGALGEAGATGLGALREGQSTAEADRVALLGQIEQSRMGRAKLDLERQALAARGAARGGLTVPQLLSNLKNVASVAVDRVNLLTGGGDVTSAIQMAESQGNNQLALDIQTAQRDALQANRDYTDAVRGLGGYATPDEGEDDTSFSARE